MDVKAEASKYFPFTQSLRRDFHRHPEIAFNEFRTAGIVANELQQFGLEVKTKVGKTGVVGLLEGTQKTPVILLRFDMDALPMTEENKTDYASENPGLMHACGHDSHTAVGLTIARILSENQKMLNGTVKFVFQPAEEGGSGADAMIEDGVLTDPAPDFALGLHVWNDKPLGWFGITEGPMMAGANKITFRITGKGGHGAIPHLAVDPVLAASHIICGLQSIVSRNISPLENAVVSITHIEGGTAFNIIPPYVDCEGTIRTFLPEVKDMVIKRFNELVSGIAESMNCTAQTSVDKGTLAVINDVDIARKVGDIARSLFPGFNIDNSLRTMGAEDMASFLSKIPGCFIFIGSANPEKGLDFSHHHPRFDIDESCLPDAVALLVQSVLELTNSN